MKSERFHRPLFILILSIAATKCVQCWPEGTFGLPMPKTGCPLGSAIDWETGSRTHLTEKGSHASENVHLAGIEPQPSQHIVQLFCMKMAYPQEGGYQWMAGKYCIFKKNDCPPKFQQGFIVWDDAASYFTVDTRQSTKGVLPDGEYNHNTKIEYCCRTDGAPYNPIQVPTSAPFYLLKFGDVCQEVDDMSVTEEWVYWADELTVNFNDQGGVHPRLVRSKHVRVYTKLFYCYYQQKPPNSTMQILLIIVYVAAGVIGGLTILSFLICAVKALCRKRQKKSSDDSLDESHDPPCRVITRSSEPPTVYRYVSIQTNDDGAVPQLLAADPSVSSVKPSAPPVEPSAPPAFELTMPATVYLTPVHPAMLANIPHASGTGSEKDVVIRGRAVGSGCCRRDPSCMCDVCVSMPPSYDEVLRAVDQE